MVLLVQIVNENVDFQGLVFSVNKIAVAKKVVVTTKRDAVIVSKVFIVFTIMHINGKEHVHCRVKIKMYDY